MSVFRRRPAEGGPAESESSSVVTNSGGNPGAARDPDLAMPAFRPQPPSPAKDASMSLPPKPSLPTTGAATPGVTMPPRPARAAQTDRRTLVVGKGISLQGTVSDAERLVVEGTVESQMIQAQELQIAHSGVFKGEVQVDDAEIAGVFDGTLTARGALVVRATGKVLGVARARKLSVEEGGQLSGRMEMLTDAQAASATGGSPAPAPAYGAPDGY